MGTLTWEAAKRLVAEEWGYDLNYSHLSEAFYMVVGEKMAQSAANEAVREVKLKLISAGLYELDGAGYFPATQLIEELPLPYPDAK